MAKKSDIPEVQKAVQAAAQMGITEDEGDRRARPAPPKADYIIEDDPILAQGDPRVHPSDTAAAAADLTALEAELESQGSKDFTDRATAAIEGAQPLIELAKHADPLSRLAASIEKLVERQAGPAPVDPAMLELIGAMMKTMESLVRQQATSSVAQAELAKKGVDPSNMFAPDCSVFNPRGERDHPRPKLKCRMFLPWEAEWESLTREEIELLNLIEPGEFFLKRNDESRTLITIRADVNPNSGKFDRVLMNSETALNNDYHWLMPPLRVWLRSMFAQRAHLKVAANEIMTMEREIELIERYGVDFEEFLKARFNVTDFKLALRYEEQGKEAVA